MNISKTEPNLFGPFKKKQRLSVETLKDAKWNIHDYRNKSRVCVIDDNEFSVKKEIENLGYNIQEIGDISSIEQCTKFDIVVCDIRGVGAAFGASAEGAFIIKEIRERFPEKYLIMYSASTFSARFQPYLKIADAHLKKNVDISDWMTVLDEGAKQLLHPYCRWARTRSILLEAGVEIYKVAELEHNYVNSLESGDPELIRKAFDDKQIDSLQLAGLGVGIAQFIAAVAAI